MTKNTCNLKVVSIKWKCTLRINKKCKGEKSSEPAKAWNSKRERERELDFKPTAKENLVLFIVPKLYIRYRNLKDGLYLKKYNSS